MSQIWEYVKIALMNIKSNKGRSILTMLGIIIGISSVIMIISIGNGVKSQINGELNSMAGGQVYLYVDKNNNKDATENLSFTEEDFEMIKEKLDHVKGVTPSYAMWGSAAGRKGQFDAVLTGGTEGLEYSSGDPIKYGKYFTASDYYAGNKVCVLTESAAKQLFGTADVVGMTVELSLYGTAVDFRIVGIRADSEASLLSMMNGGYINVEIPISVLDGAFGFYIGDFDSMLIMCDSAEYSTDVAAQAIRLLESKYNIRGEGLILLDDFNTYLDQINTVLGSITIFVVFVAAISLLVGGIGVMNIMLVSVTERTREIGIRKSLGARTSSILLQFLSESAIITLLGGIIGIIIGAGGAIGICSLLGFTAQVQVSTVLGASVFSSAVGIFFGIYPARKAARLSPIEALRHE